jgi:hypothetical protein
MRPVVPGFIGWMIASLAMAQNAPAPPARDTRPAAVGSASISGRVIDAHTGGPVRRATVRISSPAIRDARSISTDAEGRYTFTALPPGRYTANASKDGFVGWQYGQIRPFEPGKPFAVVDRQQVTGIDFRIPRGGVITGQVIDEFGDPVPNVMVSPLRLQFTPTGKQPVMTGGIVSTNDIGEFRLYGLVPGEYLVSAAPRFSPQQELSLDRDAYATTFYPSTNDEAQAQVLQIDAAQVTNGVVISLTTASAYRITGTVVDADGRAVTSGGVSAVTRQRTRGISSVNAMIRPDGTFTFNRVPAGSYLLRSMSGPPGPNSVPATAFVEVTGDVTNVRVMPEPPVMIRGRLIFDPPDAAAGVRPQTVRVNLVPSDPMDIGNVAFGPIDPANADGTFVAKGRPGRFRIGAGGIPPTWMVQRVLVNGDELPDQMLELGTRDVDDVQIVITNKVGQITGRVLNSHGEAADSYTAILFPQDRARWADAGVRPIGRPDDQGNFTLRPLRPGDYYVVAVDRVENGQWFDQGFLDSISAFATAITLTQGETRALDLTLTERR